MTHRLLVLLALLPAAAACRNSCQQVCVRMADYAEECGISIPDDDLGTCLEEHGQDDAEDRQICREYGDAESIRREWSCEELELYWE